MDASELARWTRFAVKGGIGRCTALTDCVAQRSDDLMFLKDDEITVLLQMEPEGLYLGYCEGVVGKFQGDHVRFHGKLKKPVMTKRSSMAAKSPLSSPVPPLTPEFLPPTRIVSGGSYVSSGSTSNSGTTNITTPTVMTDTPDGYFPAPAANSSSLPADYFPPQPTPPPQPPTTPSTRNDGRNSKSSHTISSPHQHQQRPQSQPSLPSTYKSTSTNTTIPSFSPQHTRIPTADSVASSSFNERQSSSSLYDSSYHHLYNTSISSDTQEDSNPMASPIHGGPLPRREPSLSSIAKAQRADIVSTISSEEGGHLTGIGLSLLQAGSFSDDEDEDDSDAFPSPAQPPATRQSPEQTPRSATPSSTLPSPPSDIKREAKPTASDNTETVGRGSDSPSTMSFSSHSHSHSDSLPPPPPPIHDEMGTERTSSPHSIAPSIGGASTGYFDIYDHYRNSRSSSIVTTSRSAGLAQNPHNSSQHERSSSTASSSAYSFSSSGRRRKESTSTSGNSIRNFHTAELTPPVPHSSSTSSDALVGTKMQGLTVGTGGGGAGGERGMETPPPLSAISSTGSAFFPMQEPPPDLLRSPTDAAGSNGAGYEYGMKDQKRSSPVHDGIFGRGDRGEDVDNDNDDASSIYSTHSMSEGGQEGSSTIHGHSGSLRTQTASPSGHRISALTDSLRIPKEEEHGEETRVQDPSSHRRLLALSSSSLSLSSSRSYSPTSSSMYRLSVQLDGRGRGHGRNRSRGADEDDDEASIYSQEPSPSSSLLSLNDQRQDQVTKPLTINKLSNSPLPSPTYPAPSDQSTPAQQASLGNNDEVSSSEQQSLSQRTGGKRPAPLKLLADVGGGQPGRLPTTSATTTGMLSATTPLLHTNWASPMSSGSGTTDGSADIQVASFASENEEGGNDGKRGTMPASTTGVKGGVDDDEVVIFPGQHDDVANPARGGDDMPPPSPMVPSPIPQVSVSSSEPAASQPPSSSLHPHQYPASPTRPQHNQQQHPTSAPPSPTSELHVTPAHSHLRPIISKLNSENRGSLFAPHPGAPKSPGIGTEFQHAGEPSDAVVGPSQHLAPYAPSGMGGGSAKNAGGNAMWTQSSSAGGDKKWGMSLSESLRVASSDRKATIYGRTKIDLSASRGPVPISFGLEPPPSTPVALAASASPGLLKNGGSPLARGDGSLVANSEVDGTTSSPIKAAGSKVMNTPPTTPPSIPHHLRRPNLGGSITSPLSPPVMGSASQASSPTSTGSAPSPTPMGSLPMGKVLHFSASASNLRANASGSTSGAGSASSELDRPAMLRTSNSSASLRGSSSGSIKGDGRGQTLLSAATVHSKVSAVGGGGSGNPAGAGADTGAVTGALLRPNFVPKAGTARPRSRSFSGFSPGNPNHPSSLLDSSMESLPTSHQHRSLSSFSGSTSSSSTDPSLASPVSANFPTTPAQNGMRTLRTSASSASFNSLSKVSGTQSSYSPSPLAISTTSEVPSPSSNSNVASSSPSLPNLGTSLGGGSASTSPLSPSSQGRRAPWNTTAHSRNGTLDTFRSSTGDSASIRSVTVGSGSTPHHHGGVRQNSLRNKLSLPNLRSSTSQRGIIEETAPFDSSVLPNAANVASQGSGMNLKSMTGGKEKVGGMDFEFVRPRPSVSGLLRESLEGTDGSSVDRRAAASPALSMASSSRSIGGRPSLSMGPAPFSSQTQPPPRSVFTPTQQPESAAAIAAHRARELKWVQLLPTVPPSQSRKNKKVKKLLFDGGVPSSVRYEVWAHLTDGKAKKVQGVYDGFKMKSEISGWKARAAVSRDVKMMRSEEDDQDGSAGGNGGSGGGNEVEGTIALLGAYQMMVPDVRYASGLTRIVSHLLHLAPEEEAFWIFVSMMDSHVRPYFSISTAQLEVDAALFSKALEANDPQLAKKIFVELGINPVDLCQPWFTALFVGCVPTEYLNRVWDIFLYEGIPFLLRASLALVTCCRRTLLTCQSEAQLLACSSRPQPGSLPETPDAFVNLALTFKMKDDDIRKQRVKMEAQVKKQTQVPAKLGGGAGTQGISAPSNKF